MSDLNCRAPCVCARTSPVCNLERKRKTHAEAQNRVSRGGRGRREGERGGRERREGEEGGREREEGGRGRREGEEGGREGERGGREG